MIYCIAHVRGEGQAVLAALCRKFGSLSYCTEGNPSRVRVKLPRQVCLHEIEEIEVVTDVVESSMNDDDPYKEERYWIRLDAKPDIGQVHDALDRIMQEPHEGYYAITSNALYGVPVGSVRRQAEDRAHRGKTQKEKQRLRRLRNQKKKRRKKQ